jgi:hypothetical protein
MRNPWKYLLAACVVVSVLVAAPLALGAGEGRPVKGGARNPGSDTRQNYTRETQIIANVSSYGTRQSNKSATGGGAIYGCRAAASASNTCVRATNLADGQAFSFSTNGGPKVGRIESTNHSAAPFTTNATGVATGLNADQVDGKSASDITSDAVAAANQFAAVSSAGTLGNTRGATASTSDGTGTYLVTFSTDISKCAYTATITGATPGEVTTELAPSSTTQVRVRTFDPAGAAAARGFHLTVTC